MDAAARAAFAAIRDRDAAAADEAGVSTTEAMAAPAGKLY
jgi:hypothetical protein